MTVDSDGHGYRSENIVDPYGHAISAHITIKHWQLKSLICRDLSTRVPNDRILYCSRNSVRAVDPRTGFTNVLCSKLSFEPRSLYSASGYTVAGAENGTIAVIDGHMNKAEYDVGGSLINGIHIYDDLHDHQTRAVISNNDYSLKFFSLSSMSFQYEPCIAHQF